LAKRQPRVLDVVVMKDGGLLNCSVLPGAFHIKTSYGAIEVKKKEVANMHMRGIQFSTDVVVTLDLNRFKGTLQEQMISVKLQDGQIIDLQKNKINTIMMLTNY
jgi:hypothetical protein